MKIAIHNAQFSHHTGGTERLIFDQIRYLSDYPNVELTLITSKIKKESPFFQQLKSLNKSNIKIKLFDGMESLGIPDQFNSNNPSRWHQESVIFGAESNKIYAIEHFDIVVTHFSTDSLYIPKNQLNVLHLHGTPLERSKIGELSIQRPDQFISVAKAVKKGWQELYPELAQKNIEVVYPNIDHNKFYPKSNSKDLDILFVGRLIKIKGIYDLIDSMQHICPDRTLTIVGAGPEKDNILKKIHRSNLDTRVQMMSQVTDEELREIYVRAKVAAFPSYAKEGMVLTMLEAASSGTAIVASNACGMPEFIKHNRTGLLSKPKNPEDLGNKIESILTDKTLQHTLGENARDEIIKNWNPDKRIRELYKSYSRLCKNE